MSAGLHVESVGCGPPLVLLHGWAMHSGMWGSLVARLAPRFRLHAIDLPGHGHSPGLAPWGLEAAVGAVDELVPHDEGPVAVLGWSLGGMLALSWAAAAPQRVGRLALIATTPSFIAREDWPQAMSAQTLARFGDELRVDYRLTLLRFLTLQMAGGDDARATLAALRTHLFARKPPSPAALEGALAVFEATDLRGMAPSIRQPTLVIAGDRDTLTPIAAGEWLARHLPHARLAAIAGAAHAPHLSHPDAVFTALRDFLDERAPAG